MKAVTIKIPEDLEKKLRQLSRRRTQTFSAVARQALQKEVEADAPDFASLAAPYCGMFHGPRDLSSREGFGNQEPR